MKHSATYLLLCNHLMFKSEKTRHLLTLFFYQRNFDLDTAEIVKIKVSKSMKTLYL